MKMKLKAKAVDPGRKGSSTDDAPGIPLGAKAPAQEQAGIPLGQPGRGASTTTGGSPTSTKTSTSTKANTTRNATATATSNGKAPAIAIALPNGSSADIAKISSMVSKRMK